MARLEVKLKQHTPILHFQGRQKGATIRPTEFKSKLDKYIIDKAGEDLKKYYVGNGEKPALDYKVRISSKNEPIENWPNKVVYFGDLGEKESSKDLVWSKGEITIEFFSLQNKIIDLIKENLSDFLAITNFGTRQSKGFGSFYVDEKDPLYKEIISKYSFTVKETDFRRLFEKIDLFYKSLRSGINLGMGNGFYCKSAIFYYANSKGYTWDKKAIKTHFLNEEVGQNEVIAKDILGLSTFENWREYSFKVMKANSNVKRYQSPLFFKIIKEENSYKVFLFVLENSEILNRVKREEFKISNGLNDFRLRIGNNLSVKEFMEFVFDNKKYDLVEACQKKTNFTEFDILNTIYDEIRKNVGVYNGK